jgi:hypothetical protein
MDTVKGADSDILPVSPQPDEDIPAVGIAVEKTLAESIHGYGSAPFTHIVLDYQCSIKIGAEINCREAVWIGAESHLVWIKARMAGTFS